MVQLETNQGFSLWNGEDCIYLMEYIEYGHATVQTSV